MLLKSLAQLDEVFLRQLCEDRCPESQTIEFKSQLPGNSERDKHELCKDVSALANTDGGDLVYGIDEEDGAACCILPISAQSSDATMRRIYQVLDANIEPRIPGLRMQDIVVKDGYVIVLRVPASFDGPHCVRNNSNRRFVMRNGASVTDMSFDQLRNAFDRTATLAERARRFIAGRLELIASRKTTAPMEAGPVLAIHLVPLAGLAGRASVDLRSIYTTTWTEFIGHGWGGGSRSFNFDGLLIHPGGSQENGYSAYNHIFRTGALEGARLGGAIRQVDPGGVEKPIVWSLDMSRFFYHSLANFCEALNTLNFAGPAVLSIAILDVESYELGIGGRFQNFGRATADRPHLIPPDSWIEDIDSADIDVAVRPLLDSLWQAFGAECCPDFDDTTGAFAPRKGY